MQRKPLIIKCFSLCTGLSFRQTRCLITCILLGLCSLTIAIHGDGIGPENATMIDITFQVTVPSGTPEDTDLFIAGDFQGWNPGSNAHKLSKISPLTYRITLNLELNSCIQFKFTRGHWGVVEKGAQGEERANRTLRITNAGTHNFSVASWADNPPLKNTVTGNVSTMTIPSFLENRRVWIYLPPRYNDEPHRRYPVLYMLDGQNIFDQSTSFSGEWGIDESCERLIAAGKMQPIIVVAVDNGGASREDEYTPWLDTTRKNGGRADEHLKEIISKVIPYINDRYRTKTGPENTGFAGSSLGGLMAIYTGFTYAETFGLIAGLSPSIWWDNDHLIQYVGSQKKPSLKIYMDMGTLESGTTMGSNNNGINDSVDRLRSLRGVMLELGFKTGVDLVVYEDEGANHHESFWAARFPDALWFLFPPGK